MCLLGGRRVPLHVSVTQCCWEPTDALHFRRTKNLTYTRSDGGSTTLTFVWSPEAKIAPVQSYLANLPEPPSHILIGWSLWLARFSPEEYTARVEPAFRTIVWVPASSVYAEHEIDT
jgi:hypothetical protein